MLRSGALLAAISLALVLSPTHLLAQCVDQPRNVALDKEKIVALRSYLCSTGTGADAAQFRIEYDRLNDTIVSLLLANGSSTKLPQALGPVKIFSNEVSRTYADLVRRFGTTQDVVKEQGEIVTSLAVRPADYKPANPDGPGVPKTEDTIGLDKLRTLLGQSDPSGGAYPAIAEITALRKKILPSNLSYYYSFSFSDLDCDQSQFGFTCKKVGDDGLIMTPWRYVTEDDAKNFAANAKAYNAELLRVRKDKAEAKTEFFRTDYPSDPLHKFISGGSIPSDFSILMGSYQTVGCGVDDPDQPGLAGWSFNIIDRVVRIDAVLIENMSKQPLVISGLFGERNSDVSLRPAQPLLAMPANLVALNDISEAIPAGQSAIILTKIVFTLPPDNLADFRKYRESMDTIHAALGSNGFSGNVSAYQAPNPKDYTYGPTLTVTGATINSARIDFTEHPVANFLELTTTSEAGSCPYLLSSDNTDHEWISHGKILHKGQGRDNAYTETVTFPDLRTRFRIEEREPEFAHVYSANLVVEMRDGSTQRFSPIQPDPAPRDGGEISLMWGDAAEIYFDVPQSVIEKGVVESRLEVTGYYERYSSLLAAQQSQSSPLPVRVNAIGAEATAR
jgi:hypothetical protein